MSELPQEANTAVRTTDGPTDIDIQGNGDWIGLKMHNVSGVEFKIIKIDLNWGKIYSDPNDKDSEVKPPSLLVGKSIPAGGSFLLSACGRNGTASGTEGTVTIGYNGASNISIYWNVPWSGENILHPVVLEGKYYANATSSVPKKGPIGNITVEFGDKAN